MINNVSNDTIKDQVNCENLSVKDENFIESRTASVKNEDEEDEEKKHLKDLKGRLTLPLETVLELENVDMNQDFNKSNLNASSHKPQITPLLTQQHTQTPTTSTNNTRPRNRTDSLKVFTDKFRSISNDLLRSIESAHEMIDLNRSHFSAATQLAAVQQYQSNENHLTPSINNKSLKGRNINAHPINKQRSRTIAASKNDSVTDYAVVKTGSINDIISNLPSDSLSSYGLINENDSNLKKFNSLNRDSIRKEKKFANNDENEHYVFKRINASNDRNDLTEDTASNKEASHYSPINSVYINSPKFDYDKTLYLFKKPNRTIDESNAINTLVKKNLFKNQNTKNDYTSSSLSSKEDNEFSNHKCNKEIFTDQYVSATSSFLKEDDDLNQVKDEDFTKENNVPIFRQNIIRDGGMSKGQDQVDFRVPKSSKKIIPDDIHISILEVFIYLWGVITFFADLISDIILSIEYFDNKRSWLGFMTLMFTIVPNVTLSLFSLSWYIDKYYTEKQLNLQKQNDMDMQQSNSFKQHQQEQRHSKISSTCDSITFWITTIFFVVFQLDLVWKYIQGFVYTLKGWACRSLFNNLKWEKYYIEKQIKCDTDIGMLRLIDVFMDSGPQVLLQLYVITTQNLNKLGIGNLVVFTFKDFRTTSLELKQLVSILSSLFSMGYALAGYHRCLRNQQFIFCLETNKPLPRPMSWLSTMMQFLWYLFLIAPRVLAMAIFASTFRSWFFMIMFTHWLIMYFWILRLKTNYCITSQDEYNAREEIFEKFYDFVCSFIYIFCYFNLKAGRTRLRYIIYYLIFYSENCLFCISYFLYSTETKYIYKLVMMLIVILGFWIAITFQIVYYLHCHPSHDIKVCVRKNSKFHFIYTEMLKPSHMADETMREIDDGYFLDNQTSPNHSQSDNDLRNLDESKFLNQNLSSNTNVLHSLSNSFNNSMYRQLSIRKKLNKPSKDESKPDINEEDQDEEQMQQINLIKSQNKRDSFKTISSNSSTVTSTPFEEIAASTSLLKSTKHKASTKKSDNNYKNNSIEFDDNEIETSVLNNANIESKRTVNSTNNLIYPENMSSFQSFSTYSSSILLNNDKITTSLNKLELNTKEIQISNSISNMSKTNQIFAKLSSDSLNKTSFDLNMSIESIFSPIIDQFQSPVIKNKNNKNDLKVLMNKNTTLLKRTSSLNN